MKRLLALMLLSLAAPLMLAAIDEPQLVPDVSQREIRIRYGFTGAELLLFGAIVYPDHQRETRPQSDIIVLLKGPSQSIIIREKQKIAGIWVNADYAEFRSAPSYYAIASSRPVEKLVDQQTAAIYEFGLDHLQLSPAGTVTSANDRRFSAGLVDLHSRAGLYLQRESSVQIVDHVLYQARLAIPSSVPTGRYTAETFLIQEGRVVAAASRDIYIRKYGFERFVADASEDWGFLYGLTAVFLSLFLGWLAGQLFKRR